MTSLLILIVFSTTSYADFSPLVFPDDNPYEFFDSFDSLYVSVYTFTSEEIGSRIQNSNTILLVEKSPVGGIPDKNLLCSLNIPVYLYQGEKRYLHAKYAIKDNSSFFISTENFGSFKNRGWGAVVRGDTSELLDTFLLDINNSDLLNCNDIGELNTEKLNIKIPSTVLHFIPGNITVFVDNYLENLISLIQKSDHLLIQQFYFHCYWKDRESPLIQELVGKNVRILLDDEWYNRKKNTETVEYLKSLAIDAKIENSTYKIHTKGMIMDNSSVLISSINWNENSIMRNREIGVVITGDTSKFKKAFQEDWYSKEKSGVNVLDIIVFFIVVIVAYYLAKRKNQ